MSDHGPYSDSLCSSLLLLRPCSGITWVGEIHKGWDFRARTSLGPLKICPLPLHWRINP